MYNNDFVNNSHSSILCSSWLMWAPQDSVRYFRMYLVDSVFPAPDSPDTMMDWLILFTFISRNALSAEMSRATHLSYLGDTYFSISTCSFFTNGLFITIIMNISINTTDLVKSHLPLVRSYWILVFLKPNLPCIYVFYFWI